MLTKRIIPCLDVDRGRVVKGVNFLQLRYAGDPVEVARRYEEDGADELVTLAERAGLRVRSLSGVRVFTDLVPSGAIDVDVDARRALERLELAASGEPAYRALATQLHLLAIRP